MAYVTVMTAVAVPMQEGNSIAAVSAAAPVHAMIRSMMRVLTLSCCPFPNICAQAIPVSAATAPHEASCCGGSVL